MLKESPSTAAHISFLRRFVPLRIAWTGSKRVFAAGLVVRGSFARTWGSDISILNLQHHGAIAKDKTLLHLFGLRFWLWIKNLGDFGGYEDSVTA
jgi:hypothetical protein